VFVQEGTGACQPLGLVGDGWCIVGALAFGTTSCDGDSFAATDATGTFAVTAGATPLVELDIVLEFPDDAPVPESLPIQLSACAASCFSVCQS
jgi:hypothetical protein